MATRRQEKVARVVKETISDVITQHLSDPRIEGLVSVTRVEMTPDLRNADVYLSIMGSRSEEMTFEAIQHARHRIQSYVGDAVQSKFCPVLHFRRDEKFKKTLEVMQVIEQARAEYEQSEMDRKDPPLSSEPRSDIDQPNHVERVRDYEGQ